MKKPVFAHCNTLFTISWILTLPILIDICTGCTLFSFWVVWVFFAAVLIISIIRMVHGFRQGCYKFCWGLIAQLLLGAGILLFFQLSFNKVIQTPVSDPIAPDVVNIANPIHPDSSRMVGASCSLNDESEYKRDVRDLDSRKNVDEIQENKKVEDSIKDSQKPEVKVK